MMISRSIFGCSVVAREPHKKSEPMIAKAAATQRIEYFQTRSRELVGGDRLELPTSTV
jgi:hypothetical protein